MMFDQNKCFSKKILTLPCLFLLAAVIACTFDVGIVEPTPFPSTKISHNGPGHDLAAGVEMEEQEARTPSSEAEAGCQESRYAGLVFGYRDQKFTCDKNMAKGGPNEYPGT